MSALCTQDFDAFMREVTGFAPFPWQLRLLEEVVSGDGPPQWPQLLDLPTGTGKTSALHIAVFALALRPDVMPRRVALVVDRRVIVDQVFAVAKRLASVLESASDGVARVVADRLRACSCIPGAPPLRATLMRGGVQRDDAWLRTPEQPTIFASTVDQVGSRLLFRGYGVSEGMRPVHAGILGTDTLYLLDEVHLATAFEQTLTDLAMYAEPKWREHGGSVGRPISVLRMSATPRRSESKDRTTFGLSDDDRLHPVLRKRLEANRPARLELVKTKASKGSNGSNRELLANVACTRALQAADAGARTIGIVMNRVAHAVAVADLLERKESGAVLLLTGRMRPFDRAGVQAALTTVATAGATDDSAEKPTFVVATSCIEAGADYDFDALVTEVASLPALRQRFGRLNRLGERAQSSAWILGSKHALSASAKPDPIYGEALAKTWEFLQGVAEEEVVDFGLSRFPDVAPDILDTLRVENMPPPVMFPNYLDLWSETRPAPHPDPDVSLWLHGKDREVEQDISLIFRIEVPAQPPHELSEAIIDALEFLPPRTDEAVAVRMWELSAYVKDRSQQEAPRVVRWTGDGAESVSISSVKAGDVLVVPAAWGGLTKGSWDPGSRKPVTDLAEQVSAARAAVEDEGAWMLRLTEDVVGDDVSFPRPPQDDASREDPEAWDAAREQLEAWLKHPPKTGLPPWLQALLADVAGRKLRAESEAEAASRPGSARWRIRWLPKGRSVRATTEDSVSSFTGIEVSLETHLEDVRAWAGSFGRAAGLDRELAEDIALAAWLHDIGKADPRFQVLLRGGDPIAAHGQEPLAKSKTLGAKSQRAAAARSGWPPGFRHELVSLALFDASARIQERAHDVELVRHLIASHHGWCRPWSPAEDDPDPVEVRVKLGADVLEASTAAVDESLRMESVSRFRSLCRRYGWHGLAYLEALLRLGDHQASRTPTERPEGTSP